MTEYGIWKTIKTGFWLGVGFIIPLMIVMYGDTLLTFLAMPSMIEMSSSSDGESSGIFDASGIESTLDRGKQIEIGDYEDKSKDGQLLILGVVTNKGDSSASSIQLEAELFDANEKFVYECSEYINNKVMPGETENFQIKCGCKDSQIPEYSSINIRVVSAHGF